MYNLVKNSKNKSNVFWQNIIPKIVAGGGGGGQDLGLYQQRRHQVTATSDVDKPKALLLGLYEGKDGPKLTDLALKFNDSCDGKLMELVRRYNMTGEIGKVQIFNNLEGEFFAVGVTGLGSESAGYNQLEAIDEGMENVRVAAAIGAQKLQQQNFETISIDPMRKPEQVAEGSILGIWKHQENKMTANKIVIPRIDLYGADNTNLDPFIRGVIKADAQNLARHMSETPANQMTPVNFAQLTVDNLCPCNISVEVRNLDWIISQNMNAFLAVARSSCEPPIFLEITYCGGPVDQRPILLVGSGITFNSGGLNLKEPNELRKQRGSMAGAGVVVGTMRALAALSIPLNVTAVIPLCENMPSGMAFKPGDVHYTINGKSIAIHDTSACDLLILADAFIYGQNTYKPRLLVDISTLTPSGTNCGLGGSSAGVFSNSHYMWKQMHSAGSVTGDRVWRLPLWKHFTHKVTDYTNFDVSNLGKGPGTTSNAAAVLNEFCDAIDWVHMDIANVGNNNSNSYQYLVKNLMTGRNTRTLIQFLFQLACQNNKWA